MVSASLPTYFRVDNRVQYDVGSKQKSFEHLSAWEMEMSPSAKHFPSANKNKINNSQNPITEKILIKISESILKKYQKQWECV